jgi:hypothetical protein
VRIRDSGISSPIGRPGSPGQRIRRSLGFPQVRHPFRDAASKRRSAPYTLPHYWHELAWTAPRWSSSLIAREIERQRRAFQDLGEEEPVANTEALLRSLDEIAASIAEKTEESRS